MELKRGEKRAKVSPEEKKHHRTTCRGIRSDKIKEKNEVRGKLAGGQAETDEFSRQSRARGLGVGSHRVQNYGSSRSKGNKGEGRGLQAAEKSCLGDFSKGLKRRKSKGGIVERWGPLFSSRHVKFKEENLKLL